MAIDSIESLRQHLIWAMRVELTLVPVYLYAAYSIKDPESEAAKLILSVVTEEMLHGTLDANMLVAIGGEPEFYDRAFAPDFPMAMPHHKPPIMLQLEPANPRVIDLFCVIEKPEAPDAPPEDDDYETQGQFYLAIEQAFERLHHDTMFSNPRLDRQVADPSYYTPVEFDAEDSGGLEAITDLASAIRALETVIHQGEGLRDEKWADPGHQELTHYYKFVAIRDGESPLGEVWPAVENPKVADMTGPVREAALLSNAVYSFLLLTMDDLYQPSDKATKDRLVGRLYAVMKDALGPVCRFLMSQPLSPGSKRHAGPPFEYYAFEDPAFAQEEVTSLARSVAETYPALAPVVTVLEGC